MSGFFLITYDYDNSKKVIMIHAHWTIAGINGSENIAVTGQFPTESHTCCNVFELYANPARHKWIIIKILCNWHEF